MKRLFPALLLLIACQQTNPAKDKAIAALNIPTGGNFVTYVDKVAVAKQAVEEYRSSPKTDAATATQMQAALTTHVDAATFWQCSISGAGSDGVIRQCQTQQLLDFADRHATVKPYVDSLKGQVPKGYVFNDVDQSKVLTLLWDEAKTEVAAIKSTP